MRISVKEGDSGYNTWQDLSKARVTLDGKLVNYCLTADEMLGYVIVAVYDPFTKLITEEKKFGKVEITFVE